MPDEDKKLNLKTKIPTVVELEGRFVFIEDVTLRQNVAVEFQYIIFLIALLDELDAENTTVSSSIHKDMIVHTGTIIESCLHYCLKKYIEKGIVQSGEVMPTDWVTRDHKVIHKISDEEEICWAVSYKKTENFTNRTQFITVNRACKKAKILTEALFIKAEKIRDLRNKIHLSGLIAIEDSYDKTASKEAFDIAKIIIENVEKKLSVI